MNQRSDPREAIVAHLPALRAFAIGLSRDPALADDMVQDAIVRAWTGFSGFTPGTNLRAWLFTILRNGYYSTCRKAQREVVNSAALLRAMQSAPTPVVAGVELADFLAAFAALADEQREALILVGTQGFSHAEAAQMCGVATGTMKSRVSRGRRRLASLLDLPHAAAPRAQ